MTHPRLREFWRRMVHLATVIIPVAVWTWPESVWRPLFWATVIGFLAFDLARLRVDAVRRASRRALAAVLRGYEERRLLGFSWMLLGFAVAVAFYPRPVVLAVMAYVTVGDAVAGLVGRNWGGAAIPFAKTLGGTLAGLAVNAAAGLLFLPWPAALAGAVLGSLVEWLPLPPDDNFTVPVIAGGLLWACCA